MFTEAVSTAFLEAVYFSSSSSTPWLPVSHHRGIGFVQHPPAPGSFSKWRGGRKGLIHSDALLLTESRRTRPSPPLPALRVQTQEPRRIRWSELQPGKRDSINFYWEIAVQLDPHANLKYWLPQYMCVQHLKSLCFNLPHQRAVFLHCNNSNFEILMSSSREVQRPLMFLI